MMVTFKNSLDVNKSNNKNPVTKKKNTTNNKEEPSNDSLLFFKTENISNNIYLPNEAITNPNLNGSNNSIGGSAFTSPLLIANNSNIQNGDNYNSNNNNINSNNNNILGSATLQNQPSLLSPRVESQIRTTIKMNKRQSFSNTTPFMNDNLYNKSIVDKSPLPQILPPSAIPLASSQSSMGNTGLPNNLSTSRKSSFIFNNLITPIMLPSLMINTPFLGSNLSEGTNYNTMNTNASSGNTLSLQTPTIGYNNFFSEKKNSMEFTSGSINYSNQDLFLKKFQANPKTPILNGSTNSRTNSASFYKKSNSEEIKRNIYQEKSKTNSNSPKRNTKSSEDNIKEQQQQQINDKYCYDNNVAVISDSEDTEEKSFPKLDMKSSNDLTEDNSNDYFIDNSSNNKSNSNPDSLLKMNYDISNAIKKSKKHEKTNNNTNNYNNKGFAKSVSPLNTPVPDKQPQSPLVKKKKKVEKIKKTKNKNMGLKINKLSLENILNVGGEHSIVLSNINNKTLANPREDNRQRIGSSCNLCQLKKCKCDSIIEVLVDNDLIFKFDPIILEKEVDDKTFNSSSNEEESQLNSKLHYSLNLSDLRILQTLQSWLYKNGLTLPEDIKEGIFKEKNVSYYKHLNKIIKITSCSHCVALGLPCNFKYGYSKEDKRLCYKLHLKTKNPKNETGDKLEEKTNKKNDISTLPKESCALGRLTIRDYYNFLGL